MNFGKNFLKKNPLNLKNLDKCDDILPLQYKLLASKFAKDGPKKIPHSYSNKHDRLKMRNTLDLLHELFKKK